MSTEINRGYVALGVGLILGVLGLLWVASNIETLRRQDGARYTVTLDDASGLPLGSPVRLAGVEVGSVEAIEVVDAKARVTLVVDPAVELHTDAVAGPRAKSLLGQKYLELRPGSEDAPRLAVGDAIVNSWDAYDVDEALNALEPVFGEEGSLMSIVGDASQIYGLFDAEPSELAVDPEPKDNQARIDEFAAQVAELRETAASARELSESARDELPSLLADANGALTSTKFDRTLTKLDRLTESTARELPGLFAEGDRLLREADAALIEVERVATEITPERVAEIDGVLDDVASASASARTMTGDLQGIGESAGPLIDKLELLSRRAAAIDELTIRKFLQEEGILTRFGGGDRKGAHERLDALEEETAE